MDPTNPTLCVIGVFVSSVMALWCTFHKKALWRYGCYEESRYEVMKNPPPRPLKVGAKSVKQFFFYKNLFYKNRQGSISQILRIS